MMLIDYLKAKLDFQLIRMKASFRRVTSSMTGKSDELLPFAEVKDILRPYGQSYKGTDIVRLDKIIGSEGRYKDFDREFFPLQSHTRRKWESIALGYYRRVEFPPVKLYKIGNVYFVSDGNHRVSVAKCRGTRYIKAEITECRTRVSLDGYVGINQLQLKGEHVRFLEKTKLDELRPNQNIEVSKSGSYDRILIHIEVHRYFLGERERRDITSDEAVCRWCDCLYCPLKNIVENKKILKYFPHKMPGDLYLWIMDHWHYMKELNKDVTMEEAAMDLRNKYGTGSYLQRFFFLKHKFLSKIVEK